jgi:RNA polymerase sigma-70 factor (ECF subfamily)
MDRATDDCDLATLDGSRAVHQAELRRGFTDEMLARSAATGDETAFEELFERHRRRIARLVGRFFSRPERVEEVVQEVFAKMYFGLGDYSDTRGASFASWLSRIAVNCCYDQLRRARSRPERSTEPLDEEAARIQLRSAEKRGKGDAESTAISRDLAGKLLARLSPDDRLVLILLDAEEMPVADIAELMDWSPSKVKVRAHRARAALRRVLGDFI